MDVWQLTLTLSDIAENHKRISQVKSYSTHNRKSGKYIDHTSPSGLTKNQSIIRSIEYIIVQDNMI